MSKPKSCPAVVPRPIFVLTGVMTHTLDSGAGLNGRALGLTYSTAKQITNMAGGTVAGPASFGALWTSNLHRQLELSGTIAANAHRGDGTVVNFEFVNDAFVAKGGSNDQLIATPGGGYQYIDAAANAVETYNASGLITGLADTRGNALAFTYSTSSTPSTTAPAAGYLIQVTDTSGRSIQFIYSLPSGGVAETDGLVSAIVDAAGRVTALAYDANKNLTSITWPDNNVLQLHYEDAALPWALTGITDEKNVRQMNWSYDSSGRATQTTLANGSDAYHLTYDTPPIVYCEEVYDISVHAWRLSCRDQLPTNPYVTTPNGSSYAMTPVTAGGFSMSAGQSQPAGSGCSASNNASAYDTGGNLVSKDDFQGNRTCFMYDSANRETLRLEGLTPASACSAVTQAVVPPVGARKISTRWHPDWRLPTLTHMPGRNVMTEYNGSSGVSCTSAPALPNGRPLPVVCKQTVQAISASPLDYTSATADQYFSSTTLLLRADGQNGTATFVDGSPNPKSLSVVGTPAISTANSKFGSGSIYFDGSNGYILDPSTTDFSFGYGDFTIEAWIYLPSIPQGSDAAIVDSRNQPYPNGASLLTVDSNLALGFYGGGTSAPNALALNSWTHVAAVRANGVLSLYVNGSVVSAVAHSDGKYGAPTYIGRVYDNAHPPFNGYIDDLRVTKGVARYVGPFIPASPYVADGSVLPSVTSYTYDPNGRVLTTTDANGKTTSYSYYSSTSFSGADPNAIGHSLGDLQSVTNPAGHVTQYTQYDKTGRVHQIVDPKGITTDLNYTPRGWISSTVVTPPGGIARTTIYNYDLAGQLTGVTDPDGTTLAYGYDAAHRLTSVTDSRGNSIIYTLDNAGNRAAEQVKDSSGTLQRSVSRIFDALNRVQQTTGAVN